MKRKALKVIKVGGNEFSQPGFKELLAETIKAQGTENACILVHGGGKAVSDMMSVLQIKPKFIDGQRVTDQAALEVAEMVLSGKINKDLVFMLGSVGLDAIGLSGVDRNLLQVAPWGAGMGLVGRIINVRAEMLRDYCEQGIIPIISPISRGPEGKYNVNADHAAGMIAGAVQADEIIFISNVPGVLINGTVVDQLLENDVNAYIQSDAISGGMIPKIAAALDALHQGAIDAVITNLDGFINNTGTKIIKKGEGTKK